MKTCFSEGKLMKQFGNPPLSKPLFLINFFMTSPFVQMSKTRTPPPPNFRGGGGGGGNYGASWNLLEHLFWGTFANGCIFAECFVGTFSRSELSKENLWWNINGHLLCERLLILVKIEQNCLLSKSTKWGEKRLNSLI